MKGTELILRALHAKGVKYIFGYTGGTIMPVIDEMDKQDLFTFVMPRHEQGATFMAQGLSRASLSTDNPQIGVCMSTSGPGAMNLVTGVADAHMDSVPIVAITPSDAVQRALVLAWGVYPRRVSPLSRVDDLFAEGSALARELGVAATGDLVVITAGVPIGTAGTTNLLKVQRV